MILCSTCKPAAGSVGFYLSLCCYPEREAAIVPPGRHPLRDVIGKLLSSAGVEPHVVNYSMVLNVLSCQERNMNLEVVTGIAVT